MGVLRYGGFRECRSGGMRRQSHGTGWRDWAGPRGCVTPAGGACVGVRKPGPPERQFQAP